jgi:hypothetical protein
MMASCAVDHAVVAVECCKLHYTDFDVGGIEVTVEESVVDSVVDAAVEIEEVEGVHSNWKEAEDTPDDDDVVVEEGEDNHAEEGAFQVRLVDTVDVEVEHGEAVHVLLLLLFQQVQQCHNS